MKTVHFHTVYQEGNTVSVELPDDVAEVMIEQHEEKSDWEVTKTSAGTMFTRGDEWIFVANS